MSRGGVGWDSPPYEKVDSIRVEKLLDDHLGARRRGNARAAQEAGYKVVMGKPGARLAQKGTVFWRGATTQA